MQLCPPLQQLLLEYQKEDLFLFLDYDGTLAEFAPNPDIINPDKELIQLLTELMEVSIIKLAIVSGRKLDHVRSLIPLKGLWLAGTYGVEMEDPSGKKIVHLNYENIRPELEVIKPYWEGLIEGKDEYYLEDKGWSIAIHANGSDPEEKKTVLKSANKIVLSENLIIRKRDNFIEICPPEAEKGFAVKYIFGENDYTKSLPIFIGDEPRDEEAFEAVNSLGGFGIIVSKSDTVTKAKYQLKSPIQVRNWLKEYLRSKQIHQKVSNDY